MNIPYMLGTIFTPSRDRAKFIGFFLHFLNGWIFSLIYVAAFHVIGRATWWLGALIGLVQAVFVLTMALPILPALHPRMAKDRKSTRLNSSHTVISYAVFCLKKK